jgi:carbamoyltransferase
MSNNLIISAYGSHNAAVSMYYKGVYTVVEVERWLNSKNAGLTSYLPARNMQLVFDEICQYLIDQTDKSEIDVYISGYMGELRPKIKYKTHLQCDHHTAHAAGAFYQSEHKKALIFTYDGGGDGGFFNVYLADRLNGIKLLEKFNQDLGFAYMVLADYLKDIKKEDLSIGNLVYAGKLMGLCSYGKVREDWLPHFDAFYDKFDYTGDSLIGGAETRFEALETLFKNIGVTDFSIGNSRFEGEFAWSIAATTQRAFERQFFKYARKYLDMYPDLPVGLSGGCALNVLLNTILLEERNGNVFVPPNTNDCGISVGGLLWYLAPETQIDLTYSGLPILDDNRFSEYMEDGRFSIINNITSKDIARFIADGNILGVIQGNSEHGSRALGNRSIICNPIEGMKDTLNNKVKKREWYRPFAPMVRVEDISKYFDFAGTESRHMVFVAKVKEEWRSKLPAITHEDGTGRLQTLTRKQNELIYDVITEFEEMAGHGVILNTSFNVNGKPILTRLSDALHILETSKLDAVYYKNNLIFRANDSNYKKYRKDEKALGVGMSDDTTIYAMIFDRDIKSNYERYKAQIEELEKIPKTKIVIVSDETTAPLLQELIAENGATLHVVQKHRLYYKAQITRTYPHYQTIMDCYPILRLLWAKEAMRENRFKTNNHIFIEMTKDDGINLPTAVDNMISNINSESKDSESSLVSATRELSGSRVFNAAFYLERYKHAPPVAYNGKLIGGKIEDLNWLFTNYEGVMNWFTSQAIVATESDFLTVSMMENNERYRPFFI